MFLLVLFDPKLIFINELWYEQERFLSDRANNRHVRVLPLGWDVLDERHNRSENVGQVVAAVLQVLRLAVDLDPHVIGTKGLVQAAKHDVTLTSCFLEVVGQCRLVIAPGNRHGARHHKGEADGASSTLASSAFEVLLGSVNVTLHLLGVLLEEVLEPGDQVLVLLGSADRGRGR